MDTSTLRVVCAYLKNSESQLEKGMKIEKEHDDVYEYFSKFLKKHDIKMPINRSEFFEMIAKAHIKELSDYYDRLKKMEENYHKEASIEDTKYQILDTHTKQSVFSRSAMDFTSISPLITQGKKLSDSEIARVLKLSIAAELDAAHTYELIADSVEDKKVQEVMRDVANEEKVHVGEFTELLSNFDKDYDNSVEEGRKEIRK